MRSQELDDLRHANEMGVPDDVIVYSGVGYTGTVDNIWLNPRLGPWQRWKHSVTMCMLEAGYAGTRWWRDDRGDWYPNWVGYYDRRDLCSQKEHNALWRALRLTEHLHPFVKEGRRYPWASKHAWK